MHAVIPSNGRYGSQRVIYFWAQVSRKTWTRQRSDCKHVYSNDSFNKEWEKGNYFGMCFSIKFHVTNIRARKHQLTVSHIQQVPLNGELYLFFTVGPNIPSRCLRAFHTRKAGNKYWIPAPANAPVIPTSVDTSLVKYTATMGGTTVTKGNSTRSTHLW